MNFVQIVNYTKKMIFHICMIFVQRTRIEIQYKTMNK